MKDKGIGAIVVVVIVAAVAAAGAGGYMVMSGGDSETPEENEGGTDLTGTVTYSGTWSGSSAEMGDMNGTWQYDVDFDSGTVTGWFEGDASGDISGSVSDGVIEASGSAALGTVEWSGSFSSDGSSVSGDWEFAGGVGSGTWEGSKGEAENDTSTDNEKDTDTGEDTNTWNAYEYEEGESYKYSVTDHTQDPKMEATVSWIVESVDGDQVTVHFKWEQTAPESMVYEETVTGSKGSVGSNTPAGLILGPVYSWSTKFAGEGLSVNNSWSITVEGTTYTSEVTRTETYAGQESYVVEVFADDDTIFKSAVSPDLALPTYTATYDEDTGNLALEIELQEYSG